MRYLVHNLKIMASGVQIKSRGPSNSPGVTGGGISGTVTAGSGGSPLADVSVAVWDVDRFFVSADSTGPDGAYQVDIPNAGVYFANTRNSAGFLNELYDDLPCSDGDGFGGGYRLALPPGTYFVSTDNGLGRLDEVYDGVACPLGPAFDGFCDPTVGTPSRSCSVPWPPASTSPSRRVRPSSSPTGSKAEM